jgi:hypothetical protein
VHVPYDVPMSVHSDRMPAAIEALVSEPAEDRRRLVVYISDEQAGWLAEMQRQARGSGRRLSASAIVRAALDQLRAAGAA